MKKLLMMAAAAGMLFASCSNENEDYVVKNNQDAQISFAAPVMYKSTRAEILGTVFPSTDPFMVYGYKYDGKYNSWESPAKEVWYAGASLVNTTVGDVMNPITKAKVTRWFPSTKVTFDGDKNYLFAAYAPKELSTTNTYFKSQADPNTKISYGKTGLKINDFVLEDIAAAQMDIMYSNRVLDINKRTDLNMGANGNETYNGINLTFKHALSSVHFKTCVDPEYVQACKNFGDEMQVLAGDFKIHSIKVVNIYGEGSFDENITDGKTYVSDAKWITDNRQKQTYVFYEKGGALVEEDYKGSDVSAEFTPDALNKKFDNVAFSDTETDKNNVLQDISNLTGGNYGLLIPQSFSNNSEAKIVIEWVGVDKKLKTTEWNLQTSSTQLWQPGKKYIYNLIFKDNLIYFAPEIDDWVDGNAQGTDIFPVI